MPAFEALLDRLASYGQPTSSLVLDDVVALAPGHPPLIAKRTGHPSFTERTMTGHPRRSDAHQLTVRRPGSPG